LEVDSASFGAFGGTAVGGWIVDSGVFLDFDLKLSSECKIGSSFNWSWNGDEESHDWFCGLDCHTDLFLGGTPCETCNNIFNLDVVNGLSINLCDPLD
jgi:hypothetical protein